jgi:hypothetical protein
MSKKTKQKTAVEWLEVQFDRYTSCGVNVPNNKIFKLTEKARQKEKEELIKAHSAGQESAYGFKDKETAGEYYQKTYEK